MDKKSPKKVFNNFGVVGGLGCVGKKTALLQAEVSASVSGLANVQF
jgi:hypothetical protein